MVLFWIQFPILIYKESEPAYILYNNYEMATVVSVQPARLKPVSDIYFHIKYIVTFEDGKKALLTFPEALVGNEKQIIWNREYFLGFPLQGQDVSLGALLLAAEIHILAAIALFFFLLFGWAIRGHLKKIKGEVPEARLSWRGGNKK